MSSRALAALATAAGLACAQGQAGDDDPTPAPDAVVGIDSCGDRCDADGDGVPDGGDQCPDTPAGEEVNPAGCADSQVSPTLEPEFPPYGLTWTPSGDLGRPGGLIWTYAGIDRADLFHIYWIVCDDPATPCGLSLDGPIDAADEAWTFSPAMSNLAGGTVVFTNTTRILLADGSTPTLSGRLIVNIVDDAAAPIPFADVATLGVTGREGTHGAEVPGPGFEAVTRAEVQDPSSFTWTPYLDYYDAQPTQDGAITAVSFGGSFYDE